MSLKCYTYSYIVLLWKTSLSSHYLVISRFKPFEVICYPPFVMHQPFMMAFFIAKVNLVTLASISVSLLASVVYDIVMFSSCLRIINILFNYCGYDRILQIRYFGW